MSYSPPSALARQASDSAGVVKDTAFVRSLLPAAVPAPWWSPCPQREAPPFAAAPAATAPPLHRTERSAEGPEVPAGGGRRADPGPPPPSSGHDFDATLVYAFDLPWPRADGAAAMDLFASPAFSTDAASIDSEATDECADFQYLLELRAQGFEPTRAVSEPLIGGTESDALALFPRRATLPSASATMPAAGSRPRRKPPRKVSFGATVAVGETWSSRDYNRGMDEAERELVDQGMDEGVAPDAGADSEQGWTQPVFVDTERRLDGTLSSLPDLKNFWAGLSLKGKKPSRLKQFFPRGTL